MIDLLRLGAALVALVSVVRMRHALGALAVVASILALIVDVALPFLWPEAPMRLELAFGVCFLGPTALPNATSWQPMEHAWHLAAPAALAAWAARNTSRRSAPLPPHSPLAHAWDALSGRLVVVAVVQAVMVVAALSATLLLRDR